MKRLVALAALFAALALPAAALEAPKDYAGKWTLSGVSEGDAACTLTLTSEEAIGGWSVDLPGACVDKFGAAEDAAAWTVAPGGAIAFIDPLRHVVLKFEPAEIGGYVAHPANGEPIALNRAGKGEAELTEQQRMSGRWVLVSMNTPVCGWTMTSNDAGTAGKLKRGGACAKTWAAKGIVGWKRVGGRILLLDAKGKAIRTLPGDSIQGFFSAARDPENLGFIRQRD